MIYFASDFHFGIPDNKGSLAREKAFVKWLDSIRADATALFLMGDLFDFWFEFKTVVPKGYTRLLGKLAELTDNGIEVHLFKGNHDLWAFRYLEDEAGIKLHRKPEITDIMGKRFFLAHGDGLGPGDHGYKFLKKVFECRLNQWLYRWLHPDLGTRLGAYASKRSRLTKLLQGKGIEKRRHLPEQEPMVIFSREMADADATIDYFIFGHVHFPDKIKVSGKAECIILGDWVTHYSYATFDGQNLNLHNFKP